MVTYKRIKGYNIPSNKRAFCALTYIYGIGKSNVFELCKKASIDPNVKISEMSESDIQKLSDALSSFIIGGDLQSLVYQNIDKHKMLGSYKGRRHRSGLPVRGQRTKTNSRTRKGKKKN